MSFYTMYQMHRSAYYYFRKHYYRSPFQPMALLTLAGMVGLVALKALGLGAGQLLRVITRRG